MLEPDIDKLNVEELKSLSKKYKRNIALSSLGVILSCAIFHISNDIALKLDPDSMELIYIGLGLGVATGGIIVSSYGLIEYIDRKLKINRRLAYLEKE